MDQVEDLRRKVGLYPPVGGREFDPPPRNKGDPPSGGFLVMFTVYVLYSETHNKIYIGFTADLAERFKSHNELGTKGWTVKFRPWKIVHTELFETKQAAMAREKQLKSSQGRTWIRLKILGGK